MQENQRVTNQFATLDVSHDLDRRNYKSALRAYKSVEEQHRELFNRIQLLKQREEKMRAKNELVVQKTRAAAQKKEQLSAIASLVFNKRNRDYRQQQQRLVYQRERNRIIKEQHQREMRQIGTALYLAKSQQAKQLKQVSNYHQKLIKQTQVQEHERKKQKSQEVSQDKMYSQQEVKNFRRLKIISAYHRKEEDFQQLKQREEFKKQEIKNLQRLQLELFQKIRKSQLQHNQLKSQFNSVINSSLSHSRRDMDSSQLRTASLQLAKSQPREELPKVWVEEGRFKAALEKVRKRTEVNNK